MVKNQMWTIIGVSLVVALVVSLVTASITGNFIKVKKTDDGTAVYTKYEVDQLFKKLGGAAYWEVSNADFYNLIGLQNGTSQNPSSFDKCEEYYKNAYLDYTDPARVA